jgi:hypothetical protein
VCGIIGVVGSGPVSDVLLGALKRLEYRGYDSTGIATLVNGRIERRRAAGKLANLAAVLERDPLTGTSGIGYARRFVAHDNAWPSCCRGIGGRQQSRGPPDHTAGVVITTSMRLANRLQRRPRNHYCEREHIRTMRHRHRGIDASPHDMTAAAGLHIRIDFIPKGGTQGVAAISTALWHVG